MPSILGVTTPVPTHYGPCFMCANYSIGKTPTECFDDVFEECGGVLNATSCGSVPRNKKQVSNIKSTLPKCTERDPLFAVIEQCKQEESRVQPFIRNVQGAPEAMCVLASDKQLHDVARFCCDSLSLVWIQHLI